MYLDTFCLSASFHEWIVSLISGVELIFEKQNKNKQKHRVLRT